MKKNDSGAIATYSGEQEIKQLEKRKGGYFYLKIDSEIIDQFADKRKTRFICRLHNKLEFQCGLSYLGDGNYFIILSKKNLEKAQRELGDSIRFHLSIDPNPLGVEIPEVLTVLLEQDASLNKKFERLTLGKKRNIIHQIKRIKDIDKQITRAIELINSADRPRKRRE